MTTVFYDSADISRIPASATYAALYADGRFAVTAEQAKRFAHTRWITVFADAKAAIGDYEPRNRLYEPGELRKWVHARHEESNRAIVYSDRSDVARALAELEGRGVHWWISTLDNRIWTPGELSADLKEHFGATIEASDIWAVQWQGGPDAPYDVSDLFGTW